MKCPNGAAQHLAFIHEGRARDNPIGKLPFHRRRKLQRPSTIFAKCCRFHRVHIEGWAPFILRMGLAKQVENGYDNDSISENLLGPPAPFPVDELFPFFLSRRVCSVFFGPFDKTAFMLEHWKRPAPPNQADRLHAAKDKPSMGEKRQVLIP